MNNSDSKRLYIRSVTELSVTSLFYVRIGIPKSIALLLKALYINKKGVSKSTRFDAPFQILFGILYSKTESVSICVPFFIRLNHFPRNKCRANGWFIFI